MTYKPASPPGVSNAVRYHVLLSQAEAGGWWIVLNDPSESLAMRQWALRRSSAS